MKVAMHIVIDGETQPRAAFVDRQSADNWIEEKCPHDYRVGWRCDLEIAPPPKTAAEIAVEIAELESTNREVVEGAYIAKWKKLVDAYREAKARENPSKHVDVAVIQTGDKIQFVCSKCGDNHEFKGNTDCAREAGGGR